jgi:hypothetical protein
MEVAKDIGEFEQDGDKFCIQQAKWQPKNCGHGFWATRDPNHPSLK